MQTKFNFMLEKTELVILKSKTKQFDGEIKSKLNRKRLFPTDNIKLMC